MATLNRQVVLSRLAEWPHTPPEFELRETPMPSPAAGEILVRNHVISCDPTQYAWVDGRDTYMPAVRQGEPMRAWCAGIVIESRHREFEAGDRVWGTFSWQDYVISDGFGIFPVRRIPDDIPLSYPLGATGINGVTAHLGMVTFGAVKAGDTVVVSTAAGATGSIASQIAKLRGARVIGIAGGPEKCAWLKQSLGLDGAIDYHTNVSAALQQLCPDGVNLYFDNVGGEVLDAVVFNMAEHGRIILCGAISTYGNLAPFKHPMIVLMRRLSLQGFLIFDHRDRFQTAADELTQCVREGRLVVAEDVVEGLEYAPLALRRLFGHKNRGKQLVLIADAPLALGPGAVRHQIDRA